MIPVDTVSASQPAVKLSIARRGKRMQVGIIGMGLIGGSMAIDLTAAGHQVIGISRRQSVCDRALARQMVSQASTNISAVADADVIVVCTPIAAIFTTVMALIPHLKAETVLTDVGSVKQPVVAAVASQWPNFVGGHPMAGTAEQGIDAAIPQLFVNRPYVLTPTEQTPPEAVARVIQLVDALGSCLYQCDPASHDQAVAWISHLPAMVSASLISACSSPSPEIQALAQAFASSGFRDTSRVGGGNPELGLMMAQHNRPNLLRSLRQYRQDLDQIIEAIEQQDWPFIEATLSQTQRDRPKFID